MLTIRKFPLFCALVPFIAGLMLEYFFQWTPFVGGSLLLFTLLYAVIAHRRLTIGSSFRMTLAGLLFFAAGLFVFSIKDYRVVPDGIANQLDQEIVITGTILEKQNGIAGRQQLLVALDGIVQEDSVVPKSGKIAVNVMEDAPLLAVGDVIVAHGKPTAFENKQNPGEFDVEYFYRSRKVAAGMFVSGDAIVKTSRTHSLNRWLTEWRNFLSRKMEEDLDGDFLAISKALILGDKSDLDSELMASFSSTGAMHVLAVSGLHIGLILLLFQKVLGLFRNRITKRQGIVIAIVLIWLYGGLTGASPSVMRAVVMFSILSAGQLLHRRQHSLNVLALSAILLLTYDPWMLFDLGFQLSYAAMIGIFLLYRPIADVWTPKAGWLRMGWEGTAVGLAATIVTMPLTLYWFYRFPNYFALANIGVMVFGFAVLLFGLIFLFTSWIPLLIKLIAVLFSFTMLGLVYWVNWVDSLPGAVSGGFHLETWELLLAYVLVFLWIVHLNSKRLNRWLLSAASLLLIVWWSVGRQEVLQQNQVVLFNGNQFVLAVKNGTHVLAFYDRKWNGSWKIPREMQSYADYMGCGIRIIPLEHDKLELRREGLQLVLHKVTDGIRIRFNEKQWFYRTSGTPLIDEPSGLLTQRLQLYRNPEKRTEPFIYDF